MPTATRSKQDVVTEFRCGEITAAARKVFAKNGYRDATVDQIADAAGVAKATVYQYFKSKQEMYMAVLRQGATDLVGQTRERMEAVAGIRAKLAAFVSTRLRYMEENRDFFSTYHSWFGSITHPASMNTEFRTLYREHLQYLEAVLRQAVEAGEIPPVAVETAASALYEMTRGVMVRRALGWSTTTVDQDIESLTSFLWNGIGGS